MERDLTLLEIAEARGHRRQGSPRHHGGPGAAGEPSVTEAARSRAPAFVLRGQCPARRLCFVVLRV